MRHRLRGLRWAVPGALASALVLATTAGANHAGSFQIGHFNATPTGENNGLTCTGTANPCLEATNDTVSATAPGTIAIRGRHTAATGRGVGVSGSTSSTDSIFSAGVRGDAVAGMGVSGNSTAGIGVIGSHTNTTGTEPGVRGFTLSNESGAVAVNGYAQGSSNNVYGVLGQADSGVGVAGVGGSIGLIGAGPLAAWFLGPVFAQGNAVVQGDVFVTGTLTKGAGAFRIQHPLDRTKYLQHSFVESPDMMNVYNGNARTDRNGFATVRLPRYFQALNRDFRYQLTVVGRSFARAIVWQRIRHNRFRIRTDRPLTLVSWQVTGIRHDAFANAHRIQPEIAKAAVDTLRAPNVAAQRGLQAAASH
jgi:hypothetical protein